MTTLAVPRLYWDTFQQVLHAKVKKLAKEIASTLGEPEQPLLKALTHDKVSVYLFEEEGSEMIDLPSMRCKHFKAHPENPSLHQRCQQPVILGKTACLQHELAGTRTEVPAYAPVLQRLTDPEGQQYFLKESTVLGADLICRGYYDKEVLRLFKVIDADEKN
jgi:hypothetical protein